MADLEHVRVVLSGAEHTSMWRTSNTETRLDLRRADFRGKKLRSYDLSGADLRYAKLQECDLQQTNLTGAWLTNARLTGANLNRADLSGARLRSCEFRNATLKKAVLKEADLRNADGLYANLEQANLQNANLRNAYLVHTILRDANFEGADLTKAALRSSDLTHTNFRNAILDCVDFAFSNGASANVAHAHFEGACFTGPHSKGPLGSFLELATANGLEKAVFDSGFLQHYLEEVFEFIHCREFESLLDDEGIPETALANVNLLAQILSTEAPPPGIVDVSSFINTALIEYLKTHPEELYRMHSRKFEELVAEILARYGWEVTLTPPKNDGGYDIFGICKNDSGVSSAWIIECKRYSQQNRVGVEIVRSLYGTKASLGSRVTGAMLATTSDFTRGAKAFKASRYDLDLRGYENILEWVNAYRPNPLGSLYIRDSQFAMPGDEE